MSDKLLIDGMSVEFNVSKVLKYVRKLGSGGTGDTHLFYDEIANKYFAIKKYVPKGTNDTNENYKRFIDEIKILMDVYHNNIVRIYNYYLYPKNKTGYIQMEFIDGKTIDYFEPSPNKNWDTIFLDAIDAFIYLENKGILHRDIRISNFLINENNDLKIIDFGFGKKFDDVNINENSVLLNWPGTQTPEELVIDKKYDVRTEIYYLGNLFKNLIDSKSFSYLDVLEKMCSVQTALRYQSFKEIKESLNESLFSKINFAEDERRIYKNFSSQLFNSVTKFINDRLFENDLDKIMKNLESVIISNSMEDYIQGNNQVISCFVKTKYSYLVKNMISSHNLLEFYKMMLNMSEYKKKIILQNIQSKLSIKEVEYEDEMPF